MPQGLPTWSAPHWADAARRARYEGERVTCGARSPSGALGVLGTHLWRVDVGGGVRRRYGARLRLYDIGEQREQRIITVRELASGAGGRSVAPAACAFTPDESMVLVVSGDRLGMYAVSNGYLVAEQRVRLEARQVSLRFYAADRPVVRVLSGSAATDFALED